MSRPRLLFYCQHSVGLGHLVRSVHLVGGLSEDFDVTLLNGGPWPTDLPLPASVDVVHLPALGLDAEFALVSRDPRYTVDEAVELRQSMILNCFARIAPDVVLVELFPFGRKKFGPEILPLLDGARAAKHVPLTVCSLRDILVSRRDQKGHDDRASRLANEYFDVVLVHADPRFATLDETFHSDIPLRTPVHYTGFVRGPASEASTPDRETRVLVSAGGGLVGGPLFRAAVDAQQRLLDRHGLRTAIVTGPFLPDDEVDDLKEHAARTPGLEVVRYVPDLGRAMAGSAVSVSQAGYNTTMDILSGTTPSVVVPYGEGSEDEQKQRARRLERLGALRVLEPARLSGDTLAEAVEQALDWTPMAVPLALDGRIRTSELLLSLCSDRRAEAAT